VSGPAAAIILAAGASTRMGRRKADLQYRAETFVARLVRILGLFCEDVIVVDSIPETIPGARVIVNPDPSRGMLSSLQCGLRDVADRTVAVCFTPVDFPAVQESTVRELIGGWSGELARIPRYRGRRGHPVLVARAMLAEFLALPAQAQAREVIHRHVGDTVYVDVEDPGILLDIDTPADYERLQ
jgi:molybdenum cofactor cytidylyltransferase